MKRALLLNGFTRPPWPLLLSIAAIGHVAAFLLPGSTMLPLLCGTWGGLAANSLLDAANLVLTIAGPANLALGWFAMLMVMMPPLLGWSLTHIWRSSLPARRGRALMLFLLAYGFAWLLAGIPLIAWGIALRLAFGTGLATASLVAAGALVWSASPWQRAALNRGHRLMRIGVRGWKADRDAVAFGLSHGGWCVLSCWPWMLIPMVAGRWHVPVMAIATLAMLIERLASPARPRWRPPTIMVVISLFFKRQRRSIPAYG